MKRGMHDMTSLNRNSCFGVQLCFKILAQYYLRQVSYERDSNGRLGLSLHGCRDWDEALRTLMRNIASEDYGLQFNA